MKAGRQKVKLERHCVKKAEKLVVKKPKLDAIMKRAADKGRKEKEHGS